MSKKKIIGTCRVCGQEKPLTLEHYIPRAAGGGDKITLYSGKELFKVFQKDDEGEYLVPKGQIKQSGLSERTLCKECNERSGTNYDKDFAEFHNRVQYGLIRNIDLPDGENIADYLDGQIVDIKLDNIKPLNIAKRTLVSFCSVEHKGLTERVPEIRKAIQDKEYNPDTSDFALYMSLHVGNSAYYGTVAAMGHIGEHYFTQAYAGIENELIAFYLTTDKETMEMGLNNCVNITPWLTRYKYDQEVTIQLELMFQKSLNVRFPLTPQEREEMKQQSTS